VKDLPTCRFGAILCDPPWAFATRGREKHALPQRAGQQHYRTAKTVDLADLDVRSIAAVHCALFMWVVDSHIPQALRLGAEWGFSFKTRAFEWSKRTKSGGPTMGMGYWTRKSQESVFLFTRGRPERLSRGVRQLVETKPREHSRKPDEVYARIEQLVPGPYCELFARQAWPGWTAWGDQSELFKARAA